MEKKLYYGAAYYPELWDENTIEEDIRYMKKIGINVVRMAEFAWAVMEPEQGRVNVQFFVDMIKKLYKNGIETVICTPTPTPPIWMSHDHPERMFVDDEGNVMSHGARQHVCTNNLFMRERTKIIVEAMAKEIGKLPGVIAWQTDNEFKCHVAECYCETCKRLWHEWLEKRYGTIARLNDAWGAKIWSQLYQSFDQVPQPVKTPFIHNASLSTMYRIFSHESIAEYQDEQLKIIKKYSHAPVTHNTSLWFRMDNELTFNDLDFISFDEYVTFDNYLRKIMIYDLGRGLKKKQNFWVMETSPSHNGCLLNCNKTHPDGYLTVEAVAAYAFGGQGFSYWLWRQQRTGCEQPHGAVLSSWGKPTIGYDNVLKTSKARAMIEDTILSTKPCQAEVAITYSDRAKTFFMTEPLENINYVVSFYNMYKTIVDTGIHRDLLFEGSDINGYKVLITPYVPYISDEYFEKAKKFVEDGGTWIIGPVSGGRTGEHAVHTDAGLGRLDELAGVDTAFTFSLTNTNSYGNALGVKAPLGLWSAVFRTKGAKVVGSIEGGVVDGMAFLTENKVGKGRVVLLGSAPQGDEGVEMLSKIINHYALLAGVESKPEVAAGTLVAPREGDGFKVWIIINMDGKGGRVRIPYDAIDVLNSTSIKSGMLNIGSYEYRILKFVS